MKESKFLKALGLFVFMLTLLSISLGTVAQAAEKLDKIKVNPAPVNFVVNGELFQPSKQQAAFIYNSSTYVPLRFAAYLSGQAVHWQASTSTVSVQTPTEEESYMITEYLSKHKIKPVSLLTGNKAISGVKLIPANLKPVNYSFHDIQKQPNANLPGIIYNNTIYVSIRFFAASIGNEVDWDNETHTVMMIVDDRGEKEEALVGEGGESPAPPLTETLPDSNPETPQAPEQPSDPEGPVDEPDQPSTGGSSPDPGNIDPVEPKPESVKVPYNTIINNTQTSISRLEASCKNRLTVVYLEYANAKTDIARQSAINKGYSVVDSCDSSFESLMSSLTKSLTDNGYSTSIVSEYRQKYAAKKSEAISGIV